MPTGLGIYYLILVDSCFPLGFPYLFIYLDNFILAIPYSGHLSHYSHPLICQTQES